MRIEGSKLGCGWGRREADSSGEMADLERGVELAGEVAHAVGRGALLVHLVQQLRVVCLRHLHETTLSAITYRCDAIRLAVSMTGRGGVTAKSDAIRRSRHGSQHLAKAPGDLYWHGRDADVGAWFPRAGGWELVSTGR